MIGLLGAPKGAKKPEGGLLEPDMDLPLAMQDEAINKGNKAKAVLKANYGPSEDKQRYCKLCEYFDTEVSGLDKNSGYCELWEFKCSSKNLCAAFEFDKEEKSDSYKEGEDSEEMED